MIKIFIEDLEKITEKIWVLVKFCSLKMYWFEGIMALLVGAYLELSEHNPTSPGPL